MPTRLAIIGLDPLQRQWLDALRTLSLSNEIELTGIFQHTLAAAKDIADTFTPNPPPTFDDLRLFLKETTPQIILLDRPANVSLEFLITCINQNIGLFSLGPPVENLAEAQSLSDALQPKSHLLYIWPRYTDSPAYLRCTQADEFVRPIKFAAATWLGMNHALAKTTSSENSHDPSIRSLTVLAWDALTTLISLIGLPTSVYAAVRGTIPNGDTFADLSGAASLTLRFPEDTAASITLSDRIPSSAKRELHLLGQGGSIILQNDTYDFRDPDGKQIDATTPLEPLPTHTPTEILREFLRHFSLAPSPHRGWEHHLEEVAATMEALVVSHRTGQAESPDRFRRLRR